MPELQRLRADHGPAVLAFERANRAYFAASISDRGDEFFDQFDQRHRALLAEQDAGIGAFYVLAAGDGSVLGRFNLIFIGDGTAKLGYRVAQDVAGHGVATATVRELCGLAAAQHGLPRAQGGHLEHQHRVPTGAHQGRVRPGRPGRPPTSAVSQAPGISEIWPRATRTNSSPRTRTRPAPRLTLEL